MMQPPLVDGKLDQTGNGLGIFTTASPLTLVQKLQDVLGVLPMVFFFGCFFFVSGSLVETILQNVLYVIL